MVFCPEEKRVETEYGGITQYTKLGEARRALLCQNFPVILIHLDRRESDGRKLAEYIREIPRYYLTPIIFIARDNQYEKWAFHKIHCYDYLIKPVSGEKMLKIICPLVSSKQGKENGEEKVLFQCGDKAVSVDVQDIVYLVADNRYVQVHTVKEMLLVPYLCLNRFAGQYERYFVQCHRAVVVNRSFVNRIDYTSRIVYVPGAELDMGRSYLKYIRKEFDSRYASLYNKK